MTEAADLLRRLGDAVRQAVATGEIGAAKSIRFHVGTPRGESPDPETMLALGDALFGCDRLDVRHADGPDDARARLCVWEHGQIATITLAVSDPPLVLLTVLGPDGALHFQRRGA